MYRPDWKEIYKDSVHTPDGDNDLVLITRQTAKLAASALSRANQEDYYHITGAAEQELLDALHTKSSNLTDLFNIIE